MTHQQPKHPDEPRPSTDGQATTEPDSQAKTENGTDLRNLHARPLGGHRYVVASQRNGSETAYQVDIGNLSCPCDDMHYNREGNEICKHLMKAILVAPDSLEFSSMAVNDIASLLGKLEATVDRVETGNTSQTTTEETTDSGQPDSTGNEPVSETPDNVLQPVREWMDSTLAPAVQDGLDVRQGTHDGKDGVIIEPDYRELSDTQKDTMKSVLKDHDLTGQHTGFGDDGCYVCGKADGDYWFFIESGAVNRL